jgi:hypothetical protein
MFVFVWFLGYYPLIVAYDLPFDKNMEIVIECLEFFITFGMKWIFRAVFNNSNG